MAAPCFEHQAKDKLKLPKEVIGAFTDAMLEHLQNGRSYPEALQALSESSGLQAETVNSLFKRDPKVFSITKQAIAKAGRVRQLRDAADAFAEQLKHEGSLPNEPGKLAQAWDLQRRMALYGHSWVFPWTHMRNWAVQIPTKAGRERMQAFWSSAGDVWRYRGEKGKALYEMDMSLMQMGDRYDFWKQSSADIVPGKRNPGDILLQNAKPSWGTRNFDSLKTARYKSLEDIYSNLDPSIKENPDLLKAVGAMMSRDLNYSTSSIMPPVGAAMNPLAKTGAQLANMAGEYNLMMSTKLFFAKHMDAYLSPLRYLAKKGLKQMTPSENAAANIALGRWGNTVAAHLGILGINYAFNKSMGWKTPNLTDSNQSDYLRIRLGNYIVPFSPMLEALRLPIVFVSAFATKSSDTAGTKLWRATWNAAHPAFHTIYEQTSGKDFRGRPVPSIRGLLAKEFPSMAVKSNLPPEGLGEYLSTRFSPIAISGGLETFYQSLRDQGLDDKTAKGFIESAAAGVGGAATSALVGIHGYEEEPKAHKGSVKILDQ